MELSTENVPDGFGCTSLCAAVYLHDFVEVTDDLTYESPENHRNREAKLKEIEDMHVLVPSKMELDWLLLVERDRVVRKQLRKLKHEVVRVL